MHVEHGERTAAWSRRTASATGAPRAFGRIALAPMTVGTELRRWWRTRVGVTRRGAGFLLIALALVAACCAWGLRPPNGLRTGGPDGPVSWGVKIALPAGRTSHSLGTINLCLDAPGRATVTGVDFTRSSGVSVTSWSVRDGDQTGLGSSAADLTAEGFPTDPMAVTVTCAEVDDLKSAAYPSELGLRLELTEARGTAAALQVRYTMGGRAGVLEVPVTFELTRA